MWSCPLCSDNYIIVSSLCEPCTKGVKRYIQLYGSKPIFDILENCLKRQKVGLDKKVLIESSKFKAISKSE